MINVTITTNINVAYNTNRTITLLMCTHTTIRLRLRLWLRLRLFDKLNNVINTTITRATTLTIAIDRTLNVHDTYVYMYSTIFFVS